MKTIARRIAQAIFVMVGIVAAGMLIPRPLWPAAAGAPATRHILILTNPIHTDIAIPLDDGVRARFPFLEAAGVPAGHPDARWLVFGWGGRAFYLETPSWSQLKPLPVLKALTVDRSVMHVDIAGKIADPLPGVTSYAIDEQGFDRLLAFIGNSFALGEDGPVAIPGAGYGRTDQFFEAKGPFNVLVGCNTWTARALREAGLRTGLWNPLPASLMLSLAIYN